MSAWKKWNKETLVDMEGERILIRFKTKCGEGHIEDATVHFDDEGGPYYVLYDGETLDAELTDWTFIPE